MGTAQIRQRLHDYIDTAEDKKLKAIYILLEDDIAEDFELSQEQKHELDRRLHDHKNGIGRTYSWDETITIIDQALSTVQKSK